MKATVTSVRGFAEAFESMFISKRSWTPELAQDIRQTCFSYETFGPNWCSDNVKEKFNKWLDMLLRMGRRHITVLRFIDVTIMTEEIHRAAQDDLDSHARRFDNRIIRSSTRLATYGQDEFSDYYKNKVMTTDAMLKNRNVALPDELIEAVNGVFYTKSEYEDFLEDKEVPPCFKGIAHAWVKSPNGYILKEYADNKDVKRGLYMLGIPSNFISKINLTEWAHVFKERNKDGGANPEVKEWAEMVMEAITQKYPKITREYVLSIEN